MKELNILTDIEKNTQFFSRIFQYLKNQCEEYELIHVDKSLRWIVPPAYLYSVVEVNNKEIRKSFIKQIANGNYKLKGMQDKYLSKILSGLEDRIIKIREICRKCDLPFYEYENYDACKLDTDNVSKCELSKKEYTDLRFFRKIQL